MGYLLAILTAGVTIIGNVTAKMWADNGKASLLAVTLFFYVASSIAFPIALKFGKLTILNAVATVFIFVLTTIAGLVYFKERLFLHQYIGLGFAFVAIALLTIEGRLAFR